MLSWAADVDVRNGTRSWFDRVPSLSNPADAPSRLDWGPRKGWLWREPEFCGWTGPQERWSGAEPAMCMGARRADTAKDPSFRP